MLRPPCSLMLMLLMAVPAGAKELYVNSETGSDRNSGTAAAPLATAQKAFDQAQRGDTVHLLPERALYRQMISLRGKSGITIEGHDVTLTGADPLPAEGWDRVSERLFRRRLPTPKVGKESRQLLIIRGRAERMGRSPSVHPPFPSPERLKDGQFAWQPVDEREGWLYMRGETSGLEWSVRMAGLATSGSNRDITVRNLHACHALNDGFNIHGDARGMHFEHVTGYENYDEGFSAHDTCQCWIDDGRFWGNDNAVADINQAETYYRGCEFRESVSVDVLFSGGEHRLEDCRIMATGRIAFRLGPGSLTAIARPSARIVSHPATPSSTGATCVLTHVDIRGPSGAPRPVELQGESVRATFDNCTLSNVTLKTAAATVTAQNTTLDARPWTPP